MKREEKTQLVSDLKADFENNNLVVVAHYSGLTVDDLGRLRDSIKKAGGKLQVSKNRLAKIALEGTAHASIVEHLKGPTIMAFAKDSFAILKSAVEFAKTNDKLVILGGAMDGDALDVKAIKNLASLPSLDELRAKIIGIIQTPGSQVARVLKAYSETEAAAA